ncbi:MAG: hypothetical protein KA160_04440 [Lacibacter sp.]|nr:hypothetical protein [Lacibacter sp.]
MKKILALLLILSFFSSCKKSKNGEEIEAPEYSIVPKVKTITSSGGSIVQSYTYDVTGRQISWQLNNSSKTEHIYNGSSVIKIYSNPVTGSINGRDTLTLNAKGLVEKSTNYQNPGLMEMYEYNKDRLITKFSSTLNGSFTGEEKYYYTNNVLDSSVYFNNAGSRISIIKYTNYNTAKASTLTNYNYGQYYLGRQSVYPYLRFEVFTVAQNRVTQYNDIDFLFDAAGRMTRQYDSRTQVNVGLPTVTITSTTDMMYY